jgi:hypothetical protein
MIGTKISGISDQLRADKCNRHSDNLIQRALVRTKPLQQIISDI